MNSHHNNSQTAPQMNILYYSNYCKHSQKIVQQLVKSGLADTISFICIDQRKRDETSNQTYILLENGGRTLLPPNVHSVPSLLLVNDKFRVITGDHILEYYQPRVEDNNISATGNYGEPVAFDLAIGTLGGGLNSFVKSEKYTFYNAQPEDLSASGMGANRQMQNYVKATHEGVNINTPPDNYRPDKISGDVSLDDLQNQRNQEIQGMKKPTVI